jgi:phage terminase large subunit GpA-like protein
MSGEKKEIAKGFFDGLRPIRRMTVSEWADEYRYLEASASSEPGLFRTARTPYLKEVQDKLSSFDPAQEIIVMKGAQLGFTEAGNNWLGYIIDVSPAPTLMVMPTDETVKRNSKIRVDPMIEASPRLREKIAAPRSRDGGNTTRQKDFPGGVLIMTGANSAVGLRSMPVARLFLDEVDGYEQNLDGEGSPIDLAKARTRTFARKKILMVSTPTIHGLSAIEREFENTDQRYYHVPCPECGGLQKLIWGQIKWEKDDPKTAKYDSVHCGEHIDETNKTEMLASGKWIPKDPSQSSPSKAGYHINSLYSPYGWYSWGDAVQDWLDAQKDVNKLRTFVNTVLGETWKEKGEAPEWNNIYNRREQYDLNRAPRDTAFITVGVDVQANRLELEIVAWAKFNRSYSLDYRTIAGDTSKEEVWQGLAAVLDEKFEREDGVQIPVRLMAVDSGYNTQHVYQFCRSQGPGRAIPTKGQDGLSIPFSPPKQVDVTPQGKKVGHVLLYNIGVSILKQELYGWLKLEKAEDGTPPHGYCHFPQYGQDYFKGLTAEELQFKVVRGFRRYEWVKTYERNEPLDCRVYARAAAAVIGMDRFQEEHWLAMEKQYESDKPAVKKKRRSSYWD